MNNLSNVVLVNSTCYIQRIVWVQRCVIIILKKNILEHVKKRAKFVSFVSELNNVPTDLKRLVTS